MSDALQDFLKLEASTVIFPANSRYYGIGTTTIDGADGRTIVYVKRRFVPQPGRFALLCEHSIVAPDRLDNLANRYLGDPQLFWRICDANNVLRPTELTDQIGRSVRITLPEGVPGVSDA